MARILIAADSPTLRAELRSLLAGAETEVVEVERGAAVLPAALARQPDVVVLDMQIGNMGAGAVCRELRSEQDSGRLRPTRVLVLLDRTADVFLARRADADAWLLKPTNPAALRRTIEVLARGEHWEPEQAGMAPDDQPEVADTTVRETEVAGSQVSPSD